MTELSYYEILEVEKTASLSEIKTSYRKLAMKYHPDRNKGDAEAEKKFKQIGTAYWVLSDESKRKQYDMFWSAGGNNPFWWGWFQTDFDVGDIFESFFWGNPFGWSARRRSQNQRGEDLEYILEIDLKTSIYGGSEKIKFNKKSTCKECDGEWGTGKQTCETCGGTWQVKQTSQTPFWVIQQTRSCPDCQGTGEVFETVCPECQWEKRKLESYTMEVDIPAGIDDGMVIKMTGEWNDGVGTASSWDLYVKFAVSTNEKWLERDGVDLHYSIEIDPVEAILWTQKELNIPILGKRTITIDAGTQPGTIIKNSDDGVKYIDRDAKGDLLLHIDIKIPKKLSKSERELYEQIAQEKKLNVNSKKWVFKKLFK